MRGLLTLGLPFGANGTGIIPITDPSDAQVNTGSTPLYLWLDANDITSLYQDSAGTTPVAANNDPVGRWSDLSGNGRHFTQATSGSRPLYKTSSDGTPGLKLDEVDDWLQFVTPTVSGYTIYSIFHQTRTTFPGPVNNTDPVLTGGLVGSIEVTDYSGFVDTSTARINANNLGATRWLNGVQVTTPQLVASNNSWIHSGIVGAPTSNIGYYLGKFSDNSHRSPDALKGMIVYAGSHSDAQVALIHAWAMNGLYGI